MKRFKTKHKTGMTLEEQVKFYKNQTETLEKRQKEMLVLMGETIFAIELLDLNTVLGWGDKRIADRLYSQLCLFEELSSGRATPVEMIRNAKDMTGVDIISLFGDILEREISPEHILEMIKKNKKKNKE